MRMMLTMLMATGLRRMVPARCGTRGCGLARESSPCVSSVDECVVSERVRKWWKWSPSWRDVMCVSGQPL
jgi:hypothetical protein